MFRRDRRDVDDVLQVPLSSTDERMQVVANPLFEVETERTLRLQPRLIHLFEVKAIWKPFQASLRHGNAWKELLPIGF